MNSHFKFIACVVATGCSLFGFASAAEQKPIGPQGDTYASIAKLPDWSGAWVIPFEAFAAENERGRDPKDPSNPRYAPDHVANQPAPKSGCAISGMPNVMKFSFAVEFLFTPGRVTLLLEQGSTIRRIYTDGRAHTDDPEPSFVGESIGHWEGETLVVHTTAITPRSRLSPKANSSGKAQITERIRRTDKDHLQIDTVVEDPIALLTSWRYSRTYERSHYGFFERECDPENDRDGNDNEPNLTPPTR